jgi:PilZ domain
MSDQRFKPRMTRRIPVNFRVVFAINDGLGEGSAIDLSTNGMCLQTEAVLQTGTEVSFSIIFSDQDDPIIVKGEVKHEQIVSDNEEKREYGILFLPGHNKAEIVDRVRKVINDPRFSTRFFRKPPDFK